MVDGKSSDPLHGVTLKDIVERLVDHYGFEKLGRMIPIRCFQYDASVPSSLKFLRRTPWARAKLEELYLATDLRKEDSQ
jgi:uncharacterized protein (DUF2132 family)